METKFLLNFIKALENITLESMRKMESNLDPDGVPIDIIEYDNQGFILASLRDILKAFDDEGKLTHEEK